MIRYGRMVSRNCEDQEINIEFFYGTLVCGQEIRFPQLFSSCVICGIDMDVGTA